MADLLEGKACLADWEAEWEAEEQLEATGEEAEGSS